MGMARRCAIHNYQVYQADTHTRAVRTQLNVIKLNGWIFNWQSSIDHAAYPLPMHSTHDRAKEKETIQINFLPGPTVPTTKIIVYISFNLKFNLSNN